MSRTRRTWIGFAACVAAVVAALGWVTFVSLRLERREIAARADAQFQESLRLGLWRMDSLLAPLIAQEAARPYSQYAASQVPNPLFNRAVTAAQTPGDTSEFIRLHFQVGPDGVIASPEVTDAGTNEATATTQRNDQRPAASSDMLARLRRLVTRETLLHALAETRQTGGELVITRRSPYALQTPAERTAQDYSARQQVANLANNAVVPQQPSPSGPGELTVTLGGFVPMWRHPGKDEQPELLFIRPVTTGRTRIVQGVWADWPRLKRWLLDAVQDVLPEADLRPVLKSDLSPPEARMLASIPAVVEVPPAGLARPLDAAIFTPTRVTLVIAWAAALAAVSAVGLVLRAVMVLGERRLQFASAVTHELRTPLTTFRMYSEMLANGMVRDDETRQEYLATLTREAERLTNVVENVLLYARVEQRRAATRCEPIAAADLVMRVSGRLAQRADEAKMQLVIDGDGADNIVVTDCQAVEQILFNLVDNSCKYASSAEDRRLHLGVRATGSSLEMLYHDHGPGIPAAEERRAFEAFRRGSREAAGSAPGVGLGLALARGLARELGGDLKLVPVRDGGAAFLLSLPLHHAREGIS